MKRLRIDVNLEELDQIIDRGTHAPLSESEGEKLKRVLHALAGMLPATLEVSTLLVGGGAVFLVRQSLACSLRQIALAGLQALAPGLRAPLLVSPLLEAGVLRLPSRPRGARPPRLPRAIR